MQRATRYSPPVQLRASCSRLMAAPSLGTAALCVAAPCGGGGATSDPTAALVRRGASGAGAGEGGLQVVCGGPVDGREAGRRGT